MKECTLSRNRFGSVDRASACGLKGPRFDSSQGHKARKNTVGENLQLHHTSWKTKEVMIERILMDKE
ncbi:hypothetical protein QTO34_015489 [Cnephaeus nilssonii]|uniref:Uncharacterized protein n=1 Tax=Cnephaeus nilssonii TaxID=3371016 RepID=A0AA40I475_CNENI|nr:hypothetical protein QTO34_015489 [Eptesicus nilssonii]